MCGPAPAVGTRPDAVPRAPPSPTRAGTRGRRRAVQSVRSRVVARHSWYTRQSRSARGQRPDSRLQTRQLPTWLTYTASGL